jgi:hypothetical protein
MGQITTNEESLYKTPDLQLKIPKVDTLLRPVGPKKDSHELILNFPIPKGKSSQSIEYELLR